jgi:hypothetical protein
MARGGGRDGWEGGGGAGGGGKMVPERVPERVPDTSAPTVPEPSVRTVGRPKWVRNGSFWHFFSGGKKKCKKGNLLR